jgi:hypothetical protein
MYLLVRAEGMHNRYELLHNFLYIFHFYLVHPLHLLEILVFELLQLAEDVLLLDLRGDPVLG